MRSERVAQCFADMIAAIDLINSWINQAGGVDPAIQGNLLVRSGIERQLLIISEAAIRLHKLDAALGPALAPDVDWPGIRGIGNFIRHSYDDLDPAILADVLRNRLGPLRTSVERALVRLSAAS